MTNKILVIFIAVLSTFQVIASDKIIEQFNSTNLFYTSAYPSGNISLSIDPNNKTEGANGLKINYTIPVSGYTEILRSYGSNTLDLSFQPIGLSFYLKGNSNQKGSIKVMLYEDNNMNGNPFESDDEIWECSLGSILNNPNWTQQLVNYTSFTKSGGGVGTLNLNRIYSWRLVFENPTSSSITENVWIDDLRQITSYDITTNNGALLNGSFIQLWNTNGCACGQWTQSQWEDQMQSMKDVCMDKLIIQYSIYKDNAWYSPSNASFVNYTNPTLSYMFSAAQKVGINLYLGLYFDETWNSTDKSLSTTYSDLLVNHKKTIDELYNLYGNQSNFEGWYIPQEINDLEWQTNSNRDLLANWLQQTASYAKTKDVSKKVIIAPYFGPNQPADILQNWYEQLLTIATNIDIVSPQDGVGTSTKDIDVDIPLYFNAIKNAVHGKNKSFWATAESFTQTHGWPIDNSNFAALPTSILNLSQQLSEEKQFATNLIQFEWGYMQPGLNASTQKLYDDYKLYSNCITTSIDEDLKTLKSKLLIFNRNNEALQIKALKEQHVSLLGSNGSLIFEGFLKIGEEYDFNNIRGLVLIRNESDELSEVHKIILP
ncbi:MAG: hypothetical protein RL060_1518 [Bacteroidota bacterium]